MIDSVRAERLGKRYRLEKRSGVSFLPGWVARLARRGGGPRMPRARVLELWALRDVSFAVQPGTILGIIGPNGAGKTTLLKVLARVTLPTEGRVVGRGRVVSLLELGAGFQPELSGRENIYLQAAIYGIPRAEVARRFDDIAEFAGLDEFLDSPVRRYSSGMYLRLAFSTAINMNPDILLADEVLAVGDLAFQERCLARVEEAGSAGLTVLFVSHDMAAIRRLCHRVIWLDGGRVVDDGDPETVVGRYEEWARTSVRRKSRADARANEHAEIVAARLLSADGQELGAVTVEDDVVVSTLFRVHTPGVAVRGAVAVQTGGIVAFRSLQPREEVVAEPGLYSVGVSIPAGLLSDRLYSVKAAVVIKHDEQESFLVQESAVSFRVYEADGALPIWGDYRERTGIVAPRLDWELARERDSVAV